MITSESALTIAFNTYVEIHFLSILIFGPIPGRFKNAFLICRPWSCAHRAIWESLNEGWLWVVRLLSTLQLSVFLFHLPMLSMFCIRNCTHPYLLSPSNTPKSQLLFYFYTMDPLLAYTSSVATVSMPVSTGCPRWHLLLTKSGPAIARSPIHHLWLP